QQTLQTPSTTRHPIHPLNLHPITLPRKHNSPCPPPSLQQTPSPANPQQHNRLQLPPSPPHPHPSIASPQPHHRANSTPHPHPHPRRQKPAAAARCQKDRCRNPYVRLLIRARRTAYRRTWRRRHRCCWMMSMTRRAAKAGARVRMMRVKTRRWRRRLPRIRAKTGVEPCPKTLTRGTSRRCSWTPRTPLGGSRC
ncbi:hypothetical protein HDK77DRAFT_201430, partial [Phyllosticta capitalensis]